MFELATDYWSQSAKNGSAHCRIEWITKQCKDYYHNNGYERFWDKEVYLTKTQAECQGVQSEYFPKNQQLKLLDVGSCYNPLSKEESFDVCAVDIAPYSKDVEKCDFINVKISDSTIYNNYDNSLCGLCKNSYDAVIFSLFLEYIPSASKRFLCCKNAYNLLKSGGILIIVTPDSKHQGANSKIINTSWKVVLANLGFMRIKYEKFPHLHCMVFRKCFNKEAAANSINWKKVPHEILFECVDKIFIPQDFQNEVKDSKVDDSKQLVPNELEDAKFKTFFEELPHDF